MRDEAAHALARRRDHPDRHQRAAPRFIWFVDRDVADPGLGERTHEGGKLVGRGGQSDGNRRRRRYFRTGKLRRPAGCMDRLRELDAHRDVAADDDVVGDPTAIRVNAWDSP